MTIKNETAFTKECMEGAMRASNFDNSRYKTFKLAYNLFGLIFGMMMIRELVLKMTGNEQAERIYGGIASASSVGAHGGAGRASLLPFAGARREPGI